MMKLNYFKRIGLGVAVAMLACVLALMPGGALAAAGPSGGGKSTGAASATASAGEASAAESDDAAPVKARAFAQRGWVTVGGDLVIAVVLSHSEKYHTWPALPLEGEKDVLPSSLTDGEITLFRTSATVAKQPDWVGGVGSTQYPEPHPARVADPSAKSKDGITVPCYSGEAVAFIPVVAKADAAVGARTIKITVTYQACNDKICRNPEDVELEVPVEIVSIEKAATMTASGLSDADAAVFKGFDPQRMVDLRAGKVAVAATGASAGVRFDVFGWQFTIDPRGWGLALLLVCAFVGGVILNFTPCVLPVIPLKIMGLANSAGNPAKCFYLGSVMSAGVVAFWIVLGVMILTISGFTAISSLFAYPMVILGIGVFILVMGLGMFGMFTVSLPQSVYMLNPKQETAAGSFMFGILTAILATPCTAPFMGTAAAWAAQTKNPTLVLAVFGAIGLGMAVPYFILSANPKLVSKMPSAGPASDLVKQVMGGLMIAVAIFFLGNAMLGLMPKVKIIATAMWWGIAVVSAATALWMLARTVRITSRGVPRVVVAVVSLLLIGAPAVLAVNMTRTDPIPWQEYEATLVQSEAKAGKVVVLDFTAEWCLNCKALESSVLRTEEVVKLLNAPHVSVVKADVTAKTAPGWKALAELGEVGIPLLVVLKKDTGEVVFKSNAYTPQQVIDAVELARK